MVVDGALWNTRVDGLLTDAVFSPDGSRIAAVAKDREKWRILVDDRLWPGDFDMVYQPVFSPGSDTVAVKVEKAGKFGLVLNGKPWSVKFDAIWEPVFSPDGTHIMVRSIENDVYSRRVMPVSTLTGS